MGKIVLAMVICLAIYAASVWNYRRFMPRARVLGAKKYKIRKQDISFEANGRHIFAEVIWPEGIAEKIPAVICSHGYGSSYKLCEKMIGKSLAMSGYAAICFDFCGGSRRTKSDWDMSKMTIFTEKEDLLAVIDRVKTLGKVDPKHIYLLGESQGGMVSAITAAERSEDVRAMVLYYPAFCIPEDAHKKFRNKEEIPEKTEAFGLEISRNYYASVWDFDVFSYISEYKNPVLILHGDKDTVVDISYGKRGADSYTSGMFVRYPGEIHGFYAKGKQQAAKQSYTFFEQEK